MTIHRLSPIRSIRASAISKGAIDAIAFASGCPAVAADFAWRADTAPFNTVYRLSVFNWDKSGGTSSATGLAVDL